MYRGHITMIPDLNVSHKVSWLFVVSRVDWGIKDNTAAMKLFLGMFMDFHCCVAVKKLLAH